VPRTSPNDGAPGLKVGGVTSFSATDYPGKLAAVVFIQGCPWRCGYCHNPHLQPRTRQGAFVWEQVMAFLERRRGLIDAVVFSGGEPTIDPALPEAMEAVRKLGFGIGLHTAGIYPQRLMQVLPLVDWVGLDVKAAFGKYEKITQVADSGASVSSCLEAVLASDVAYEVRTTVHADLLNEQELLDLAKTLAKIGVHHYALQAFRPQGCAAAALNAADLPRFSPDLLEKMASLFPHFTLRRE
jgi:anaerobic ribonucleoside-triphosphate reductase activating protein